MHVKIKIPIAMDKIDNYRNILVHPSHIIVLIYNLKKMYLNTIQNIILKYLMLRFY